MILVLWYELAATALSKLVAVESLMKELLLSALVFGLGVEVNRLEEI